MIFENEREVHLVTVTVTSLWNTTVATLDCCVLHCYYLLNTLIIVALWNRADHYIFILSFVLLLSFFFFSSPISQPLQSACLPYLHTLCGLSADLRSRSETCCTRLAENIGHKKVVKNRHLGTIAQLCRAISSQIRHISTIGKKTC